MVLLPPLEGNCTPSKVTTSIPLIFLCLFPPPRPRQKNQTNKETLTNGHFSLLWLTTNHFISPAPSLPLCYISPKQNSSPPTSSVPVPLLPVCLNVCFCSVSLQRQMASTLSLIQCWGCVRWNLMPTCAPRHVFHTTNGSLLSVCLHCWAKLSTLTPMNH